MPTVLAFPASLSQMEVNIPTGTLKTLGPVNVSNYSQIRVVAFEYPGSPTNVQIILTFTDSAGAEYVAPLDTLTFTPGSNQTKVYDVPGTFLVIQVIASPGKAGQDAVGFLIYGN